MSNTITLFLLWLSNSIHKIKKIHQAVQEIQLIKESCNLIGWRHFGLISGKWGMCQNVKYLQSLPLTIVYLHTKKFKKRSNGSEVIVNNVYFGPVLGPIWANLGQTRFFLKNPFPSVFIVHSPLTSCIISEKTNDSILKNLWKSQFLSHF